ncbi:MAG: hypothetical protein WAO21_02415 [Verrucomicrobiia bacterium]
MFDAPVPTRTRSSEQIELNRLHTNASDEDVIDGTRLHGRGNFVAMMNTSSRTCWKKEPPGLGQFLMGIWQKAGGARILPGYIQGGTILNRGDQPVRLTVTAAGGKVRQESN